MRRRSTGCKVSPWRRTATERAGERGIERESESERWGEGSRGRERARARGRAGERGGERDREREREGEIWALKTDRKQLPCGNGEKDFEKKGKKCLKLLKRK